MAATMSALDVVVQVEATMTDPGNEPATSSQLATPAPGAPAAPPFEERMEGFGREVEEAAQRVSRDPALRSGVDLAARVWGAIFIGLGAWFLAEYTLGYDLPSVPWRDLWPVALILLGGAIVIRGAQRRT
jgi:hypothetical protein